MMIRTTLIGLSLLSGVALAQLAIQYRDREGNFAATGPGGGSVRYRSGGGITLLLKGSGTSKAAISSKVQGLDLRAGSITAEVVPTANQQNRNRISSAKATGGVEIDKTVSSGAVRQSTSIRAASATYAAGSTEGRLDLEGQVTIRNEDSAKRQTSMVTGTNGTVLIDPDVSGNEAVRTATLSGPVKVTVVEAPAVAGALARDFTATGNRLVYSNTTKPSTITLSGNVKVVGSGEGDLNVQGADQAIITLNEKGEMTEVEMRGNPTTTTYRKAGNKG